MEAGSSAPPMIILCEKGTKNRISSQFKNFKINNTALTWNENQSADSLDVLIQYKSR